MSKRSVASNDELLWAVGITGSEPQNGTSSYGDPGAGALGNTTDFQTLTTIMVRTATGMCWAALIDTRNQPSNEIDTALDQMMWNMVRTVPAWGA